MDVELEFRKVRAKLQKQIDRDYIIAMARVNGMTPLGYAMTLDTRRREEQEAKRQRDRDQAAANAQNLGRLLRQFSDSWKAFAENLNKGFNGG